MFVNISREKPADRFTQILGNQQDCAMTGLVCSVPRACASAGVGGIEALQSLGLPARIHQSSIQFVFVAGQGIPWDRLIQRRLFTVVPAVLSARCLSYSSYVMSCVGLLHVSSGKTALLGILMVSYRVANHRTVAQRVALSATVKKALWCKRQEGL